MTDWPRRAVLQLGLLSVFTGCLGPSNDDSESISNGDSPTTNYEGDERADFLIRNKTTSSVTLEMSVTGDSGDLVLEKSYELARKEDEKGEVKDTINELRGQLYDYTFTTGSGLKESREYGASPPEQLRVKIRSSDIEIVVVA